MNPTIRIAIADDHKIFRSGVVSILSSNSNFQVVQQASNGRELLLGLEESCPDVILLDLEMPILSGRETLTKIRAKNNKVKILVLSMHNSKAFIYQMMDLGANGYLVKNSEPREVISAIEKVHVSDFYFSEQVSRALLHGVSNRLDMNQANIMEHGLSDRELDVLRLICKEMTTAEIGKALFLSPKTIEGYRKVLMEKIEARNMAGLVLFAVKHGLLNDAEDLQTV